ncbi:TonB-dependent receptor [uncultured Sphingomonas sp.]|uniref:TonB-dependent receptor domain-containing protein n=1 Tax=uncultured Sphingomonas sp. TaxID=158754 RepID=UPI0025D73AB7|nr:TonB-dependent receptor [uncultured Sphingomonas sp.]
MQKKFGLNRNGAALGALVTALLTTAAPAQISGTVAPPEQADSSAAAPANEIIVTGSRIPQAGLRSVSPITTVAQEEARLQGTTSVETLLNRLPQVVPDATGTSNSGSTGIATVNLRGLGANRTLVLIDGKRLMPGDPFGSAADLNAIPTPLIENVEVVTGGASAVYGSDAVAGVVNFKLRRNLNGVLADAQYGFYQHDNNNGVAQRALTEKGYTVPNGSFTTGANYTASLAFGANFAEGRGNITAYGVYRKAKPVFQGKYDYSACALAGSEAPFTCLGSGNYNRFVVQGTAPQGTQRDFFAETNGTLRPYNGATDTYNYTPINYFSRPDKRYQIGALAHYAVIPEIELYADAMFTKDRSRYQIAESALFLGSAPTDDGSVHIACDNPLLTADHVQKLCTNFGLSGSQQTHVQIGRRSIEGGPRYYDQEHTSYRFVGGFRGEPIKGFTYDVSAQYGRTDYFQQQLNQLSVSRVTRALDVVNVSGVATCRSVVDGTDPSCVPLNVLGGLGSWTPEMLNYIATDTYQKGDSTEKVISATLAGDLGQYGVTLPWATDGVGFALGYEWRDERVSYTPGANDLTGDIYGGTKAQVLPSSGFDVNEFYGEVRIPLIQDVRFVRDLTFEGGYRTSKYSRSGRVNSYKLALDYAPSSDIRVRASLQRAVRAPTVNELFSPIVGGNFGAQDPCSGEQPRRTLEQCGRTGVLPSQYGLILECPADQCTAIGGGNPALTPEKADTRSIGFVLTPRFIRGLNITADYFDIKIKGAIGTIGGNTILTQCLETGNPLYCDRINRNGSGALFGGATTGISDVYANVGGSRTQGIDVSANYSLNLTDMGLTNAGRISFALIGTASLKSENEPLIDLGTYDCAGVGGRTCGGPNPKWRHQFRTSYDYGNAQLSLNWRYIGRSKYDGNEDDPFLGQGTDLPALKAYSAFDLAATLRLKPVLLRAGINNVFDKDPQILGTNFYSNLNGPTYPGWYDALGRSIFFGATVEF